MSDSSATATYLGQGLTVSGWQSRAEARDVRPDECDMTATQDGNAVRLEGETGEAYPGHAGTPVPNLDVTHVSRPAKTRGLPGDVAGNQSPLTAGQGLRGRRGK